MIVNADAAQLEFRVAAFLSQDKIAIKEIRDSLDIHSDNQQRFGLPSGKEGRLVAKVFIFRILFGGTAYSFANDADFMGVSTNVKFWQKAVDQFYEKYAGIGQWHRELIETAQATGQIEIPSGRIYKFKPKLHGNEYKWPLTTIKNYPVQGFSADLMMLARIAVYRRLKHLRSSGLLLCNTVHDSLMLDSTPENVDIAVSTIRDVFRSLPELAGKCFGINYNVPMDCDIEVGHNWLEMEKV